MTDETQKKAGLHVSPLVVGAAAVTAGIVTATLVNNKKHQAELKELQKKVVQKGKEVGKKVIDHLDSAEEKAEIAKKGLKDIIS